MLRISVLLGALGLGTIAHAQSATEIFKCVDAKGRASYTNDRREAERQKCEVVTRQVNVAPAQKPAAPRNSSSTARPNEFPKESPGDRAKAQSRQREILENELAQEQASLAKARQELAAQESVRSGDERNYARVEERLRPFKDSVETHEKNIEALKRELSNLR